nr:MAG: hypothetical protein AM325_01300 [Candidatus Thorarchaeota archaeon SMTZ1-45]
MEERRLKPLKVRGRVEMPKDAWNTRATTFEKNVEKHIGNVKVLLLGPGYPEGQLEIRTQIADRLEKDGCDIYIMETMSPISSFNIDEKFRDILNEIRPELIICVFTKEGAPHGVIYEVGFICGHYGIDQALSCLRFCFHNELEKIKNIPAYLYFLLSRTQYWEFYDEGKGPTLYTRIIQLIRDEVVRQYCPTDLSDKTKTPRE